MQFTFSQNFYRGIFAQISGTALRPGQAQIRCTISWVSVPFPVTR